MKSSDGHNMQCTAILMHYFKIVVTKFVQFCWNWQSYTLFLLTLGKLGVIKAVFLIICSRDMTEWQYRLQTLFPALHNASLVHYKEFQRTAWSTWTMLPHFRSLAPYMLYLRAMQNLSPNDSNVKDGSINTLVHAFNKSSWHECAHHNILPTISLPLD